MEVGLLCPGCSGAVLVAAALLGMLLAGPAGESSEKSKKVFSRTIVVALIYLQNNRVMNPLVMSHDSDTPSIIPKR